MVGLENCGVPCCSIRVPLVQEGFAVARATVIDLLVLFLKVFDDGEALEVRNSLPIPISNTSQSLLINLFDFLQVGVYICLGRFLPLNDQVPRVFYVLLAGGELGAVLGDLAGSEFIGFFEGGFVEGAGEHGVFDGAVLHRKPSNLHPRSLPILLRHLIPQRACPPHLTLRHHRLLRINTGRLLSLQSTGCLLTPPRPLLENSSIPALLNNTAFLAVIVNEFGNSCGRVHVSVAGEGTSTGVGAVCFVKRIFTAVGAALDPLSV